MSGTSKIMDLYGILKTVSRRSILSESASLKVYVVCFLCIGTEPQIWLVRCSNPKQKRTAKVQNQS